MHLPSNLAAVDPIVAAFCGGSVGVLSALLVVEANNAKVGFPVSTGRLQCIGRGQRAIDECFREANRPWSELDILLS